MISFRRTWITLNLSRLSLKPERYGHVPRLKYLEDDGQLRDELPVLSPLLQRPTELPLGSPAIGQVVGLQPLKGFIDHAPLSYARAMLRGSTEFV